MCKGSVAIHRKVLVTVMYRAIFKPKPKSKMRILKNCCSLGCWRGSVCAVLGGAHGVGVCEMGNRAETPVCTVSVTCNLQGWRLAWLLFCFWSVTAACAYSSFSFCSIQVTLNTLWGHPKPFTSNPGTLPWPTSTKDSSTPSRSGQLETANVYTCPQIK